MFSSGLCASRGWILNKDKCQFYICLDLGNRVAASTGHDESRLFPRLLLAFLGIRAPARQRDRINDFGSLRERDYDAIDQGTLEYSILQLFQDRRQKGIG
jgi:hypothetical protein